MVEVAALEVALHAQLCCAALLSPTPRPAAPAPLVIVWARPLPLSSGDMAV